MAQMRVSLKSFYINRPSKYSFLAVALILIAFIGLGVIYINRGVYFADFHSGELVKITTDGTVNVVDQYSNLQYVSRLDRDNSILEIQSMPDDQFNKLVSDITAIKGVTKVEVIAQTRILPGDLMARLTWGILAIVIVTGLYLYFNILRKLTKLDSRLTWQMLGLYTISLVIGLVSSFGLVSLVSRFYQITDVSISSVLLGYLWGAALLTLVMYETFLRSRDMYTDIAEMLALNRRRLSWINKIAVVLFAVILIAIMIGFGKRFVIEGALLGSAVMLVGLSLQVIPNFLVRLNTSDVRSYTQMLRSYNSQVVPLYNQEVESAAEATQDTKSKKRSGNKGHKPKRRQ